MATLIAKKDIKKLSVEQRLELIGLIWDTIDGEEIPLSKKTIAEMERRAKWARENPDKLISHEEMMARLRTLL